MRAPFLPFLDLATKDFAWNIPLRFTLFSFRTQPQCLGGPHAISLFISGCHHALKCNRSHLSPRFSLLPLSKQTLARAQETTSREMEGAPEEGRARWTLGIVVNAARRRHGKKRTVRTTQMSRERREARRQHSPKLGIPRRSSRHKRGRAESKKRPTTPREAMAQRPRRAQCPPLPAVSSGGARAKASRCEEAVQEGC